MAAISIKVWNTNAGMPGKRGISRSYSRRDLERTAMDYLTMDEDTDFDEALEIVESSTDEELVQMIYRFENGMEVQQ